MKQVPNKQEDEDEEIARDRFVSEYVLPSDSADERAERKRFLTENCASIVDSKETEDAIIVPRKQTSGSNSVKSATKPQEELQFESRAKRIATSMDVAALDTWWGTGPTIPDRRLESSMPGHVSVSEVDEVMVKKASRIQQLRDELPLDDLCLGTAKYLLWQMKLGKVCLLSFHRVVSDEMYEKVLRAGSANLLNDSLKLIVIPVNLMLSVPVKGPRDADTVGAFFGPKNVHFSRPSKDQCKHDVAMVSIDLYSVWSLRMLLPSVAFTTGRMVDLHLVSYRDNAVLASYRCAMTPEVIEEIKKIGG